MNAKPQATVLSFRQAKAVRCVLDWSVADLVKRSRISAEKIEAFENGGRLGRQRCGRCGQPSSGRASSFCETMASGGNAHRPLCL